MTATIEDIQSEITGIKHQVYIATLGRAGVRRGGTIECIRETLAETEAWPIGEHFGIFAGAARAAKDKAIVEIGALLVEAEKREQQYCPTPAPSACAMTGDIEMVVNVGIIEGKNI